MRHFSLLEEEKRNILWEVQKKVSLLGYESFFWEITIFYLKIWVPAIFHHDHKFDYQKRVQIKQLLEVDKTTFIAKLLNPFRRLVN